MGTARVKGRTVAGPPTLWGLRGLCREPLVRCAEVTSLGLEAPRRCGSIPALKAGGPSSRTALPFRVPVATRAPISLRGSSKILPSSLCLFERAKFVSASSTRPPSHHCHPLLRRPSGFSLTPPLPRSGLPFQAHAFSTCVCVCVCVRLSVHLSVICLSVPCTGTHTPLPVAAVLPLPSCCRSAAQRALHVTLGKCPHPSCATF